MKREGCGWNVILISGLLLFVASGPALADRGSDGSCKRAGKHCRRDAQCCDGLICGENASCEPGCRIDGLIYPPAAANPRNSCQVCSPAVNTQHWSSAQNGRSCSDGNACTTNDVCTAGVCTGGPPPDCDDGDMCTVDSCDAAHGCSNTPVAEGEACDMWGVDGQVSSTARSGDTLFVGGSFHWAGPPVGGGILTDARTGAMNHRYPKVFGVVWVATSDSAGGWYIGGAFTRVGNAPRHNLAHILADGTVAPWDPNADGEVGSIALSGGVVYIGGNFQNVGGARRYFLAAVDKTTGLATDWDPSPDAQIASLASHRGTLYVGGYFDQIAGVSQFGVAAFDVTTGSLKDWAPLDIDFPSGIESIAVDDRHVILLGGERLRAYDTDTGRLVWSIDGTGASSMALDGSALYLGGSSLYFGGEGRYGLAALDAATGLLTSWTPDSPGDVVSLAAGNGAVYTAYHAYDEQTGAATDWQPPRFFSPWDFIELPNFVEKRSFAVSGDTVFVGGDIAGIDSEGVSANSVVAIDVRTGRATAWRPAGQFGGLVRTIVLDGNDLYVGGEVWSLDETGAPVRSGLAVFDVNDGSLKPWSPPPLLINSYDEVEALAITSDKVYAGVRFHDLVELDKATAQPTDWDPDIRHGLNGTGGGYVKHLAMDGRTLFVGGNFRDVDGEQRLALAAFDLPTRQRTSFDPDGNFGGGCCSVEYDPLRSLNVAGGSILVTGHFSQIGGQPRLGLAALDPTTGLATSWNPQPDGLVDRLVVDGDRAFVSGSFIEIGGQPRSGLAALDLATGTALPWTPAFPRVSFSPLSTAHDRLFGSTSVYECGEHLCVGIAAIRGPGPSARWR